MPLGVLIALYLKEFAAPKLRAIQLVIDLMNGLPSIVIASSSSACSSTATGRTGSRAVAWRS